MFAETAATTTPMTILAGFSALPSFRISKILLYPSLIAVTSGKRKLKNASVLKTLGKRTKRKREIEEQVNYLNE
jgi:hypothetical protein